MIRNSIAIIVLAGCLAWAATASGQSSEITFYAGGFQGDSFIIRTPVLFDRVDAVMNDDFTGGLRYAYFFTNYFAGEVGAGYTPSTILGETTFGGGPNVDSVIAVDTYIFHANLLAHLFRGPVIPYVTAGVSAVHFSLDTSASGFLTPSETDFAWNAGAGFKIPVKSTTAIRFDARRYFMSPEFAENEDLQFTEISGGLSILFDF